MRDCEVALRSQLVEDLGLKVSERIRPLKSSEQNDDYECDVCHSILYISMVIINKILIMIFLNVITQ
jgi:hypothetical protein